MVTGEGGREGGRLGTRWSVREHRHDIDHGNTLSDHVFRESWDDQLEIVEIVESEEYRAQEGMEDVYLGVQLSVALWYSERDMRSKWWAICRSL